MKAIVPSTGTGVLICGKGQILPTREVRAASSPYRESDRARPSAFEQARWVEEQVSNAGSVFQFSDHQIGLECFLAVAKMDILGIALIVVGLALVSGGIIFYRSGDQLEARREDAGEVNKDKVEEPPERDSPIFLGHLALR